jgi:hypothetical protein
MFGETPEMSDPPDRVELTIGPALPQAGRLGCPTTDRATASLRLQLAQNLLRSLGGAAGAERARTPDLRASRAGRTRPAPQK